MQAAEGEWAGPLLGVISPRASWRKQLLAAAMQRTFEEGLRLTQETLDRKEASLHERLVDALDAWFGRHLVHFHPASLEVLEPGERGASRLDHVKAESGESLVRLAW